MKEEGGSAEQKYSVPENEWYPDRSVTPFVLTPHLEVTDPNGTITEKDQSLALVNCHWYLDGGSIASGEDYNVDATTKALQIFCNYNVGVTKQLSFSGQFYNERRAELSTFTWKKTLGCVENIDYNVDMEVDTPALTQLSPFKMPSSLAIHASLKNGKNTLTDTACRFKWYFWSSEEQIWVMIETEAEEAQNMQEQRSFYSPLCYESGQNTSTLNLRPELIDNEVFRLVAYCVGAELQTCVWQGRIKRFYGAYDEDIVFLEGKYLFEDTPQARARVKITNRQGEIANPERFFDIEMFYTRGGSSAWFSVADGPEAEVPRRDFGADSTSQHKFGCLVREKSALRPLTLDGYCLLAGGKAIVIHQPTTERII